MQEKEVKMTHLSNPIRIYPTVSVVDENGAIHPLSSFENKTCPYMPVVLNVFEINGNFYQELPDGSFCKTDPLLDSEKPPHLTVTWLNLPENLRFTYVEENWPHCNLGELLTMVHGEQKGAKVIKDTYWLLNHVVYTTDITTEIKEKIGKFDKIKELQSGYVFPDAITFDESMWFQYLLDDRYLVTVTEHSNPFKNLDYDMLPKKAAVLMEKFAELANVTVTIVDLNK